MGILNQVDLNLKMSNDEYLKILPARQLKLVQLQQEIRAKEIPVLIVYEGWDASGKGGSILRITQKLDPRGFHVWPVGAPNEVEQQYTYLWRFWTRVPGKGQIAIFDRSWYGRVMVERVEAFAKEKEWKRAYDEINSFEQFLADNGVVLVKFWMQISKDEQLRRFKERESDPFKKWKITPDDWRNREKWHDYEKAAEEMFERTNTSICPWNLVPAECKRYGRIFTMDTVIKCIGSALKSVG